MTWRVTLALVAACFLGCAPSTAQPTPAPVTPPPVKSGPDYLVVAPRAFESALEPLLSHRRSGGHTAALLFTEQAIAVHGGSPTDPMAIHKAIRGIYQAGHGALRFVLLVGDVPRQDEPPQHTLATFYLDKMSYDAQDAYHAERHVYHRSLLHVTEDEHAYPTDYPFGVMRDKPGTEGDPDILVGRVPARSTDEVSGFVAKLIRYETREVEGTWPRRVVVRGGPARFGAALDRFIEQTALNLLDQEVPYLYDVDVVFAKEGSDYSYPFDLLGDKLVEDANRGAFVMAYVGHSSPAYFDTVDFRGRTYSIGSRDDFERMRIDQGAPIFLSLSCDVGAFDMSSGRRSIAEEAILNPGGPIAAFASSRVSHPYPNLLYGEAFLEHFLIQRPTTLGEGIDKVKRDLLSRSNLLGEVLSNLDTRALKREHLGLYNLFGDPATRLRYPGELQVSLPSATGPYPAGRELQISLATSALEGGAAFVTLETMRSTVSTSLVPATQIEELPDSEALATIAHNYKSAANKLVSQDQVAIEHGRASLKLVSPPAPGRYVVKVFATGQRSDGRRGTAWGHTFLDVE